MEQENKLLEYRILELRRSGQEAEETSGAQRKELQGARTRIRQLEEQVASLQGKVEQLDTRARSGEEVETLVRENTLLQELLSIPEQQLGEEELGGLVGQLVEEEQKREEGGSAGVECVRCEELRLRCQRVEAALVASNQWRERYRTQVKEELERRKHDVGQLESQVRAKEEQLERALEELDNLREGPGEERRRSQESEGEASERETEDAGLSNSSTDASKALRTLNRRLQSELARERLENKRLARRLSKAGLPARRHSENGRESEAETEGTGKNGTGAQVESKDESTASGKEAEEEEGTGSKTEVALHRSASLDVGSHDVSKAQAAKVAYRNKRMEQTQSRKYAADLWSMFEREGFMDEKLLGLASGSAKRSSTAIEAIARSMSSRDYSSGSSGGSSSSRSGGGHSLRKLASGNAMKEASGSKSTGRVRRNTLTNRLRTASVASHSEDIRRLSIRTFSAAMVRQQMERDQSRRRGGSVDSDGSGDESEDEEEEEEGDVEGGSKEGASDNRASSVIVRVNRKTGVRHVVAGSFRRLVNELVNPKVSNPEFLFAFLLSFRQFCTSMELLVALREQFVGLEEEDEYESDEGTRNNSKGAQMAFEAKVVMPRRLRVVNVLKTWIQDHFQDFYDDEELMQAFYDFTDTTMFKLGMEKPAELLQRVMQRSMAEAAMRQEEDQAYSWAGNILDVSRSLSGGSAGQAASVAQRQHSKSVSGTLDISSSMVVTKPRSGTNMRTTLRVLTGKDRPLPHLTFRRRKAPSHVLEIHAEELARQLTLIEHMMFVRIRTTEFVNTNWTSEQASSEAPHIMAMIKQFNIVTQWVATTVVLEESLKRRTSVLGHFIKVAGYAYRMRNFNTTMEIIAGLLISPVWRLEKTWENLGDDLQREFDQLSALTSPMKDHKLLRDEMNVAVTPCILFIGLLLGDIMNVDGMDATTSEGLIHFDRYFRSAMLVRDLKQSQYGEYDLEPVPEILEWLRNVVVVNDAELSSASEQRVMEEGFG